jgi:demethylmenaquinone methyltransferase/2-methoxy-6-polyprenyl-1,4-benzoquinol methylase
VPEHTDHGPGEESAESALLSEQRTFYRQRAPEYDEWWQHLGRYHRGEDRARHWDQQIEEVAAALERFGPGDDVLELAGGTGWWTERLARTAESLTVVDSSPEVLDINRDRVGPRPNLSYVVADLFEWRPERLYEVVFFSFWLSHVPRARFGSFWHLVGSCIRPGGRVFLIDNRRDATPNTVDPYVFAEANDVQRRRLNDGSEHRVVKIFYEPDELARRLKAEGWEADIAGTPWFIFGSARRDDG